MYYVVGVSRTVSVRMPEHVWAAIEERRLTEGRSFSQMQIRLLERALDGGEPSGRVGLTAPVPAVDVGGGSTALSSPPSPEIGRDGGRSGGDKGAEDVSKPRSSVGLSSGPRHDSCSFDTPRGVKCKACGKVHL